MTRYAKRTDDNHTLVKEQTQEVFPEASIEDMAGAGNGFPDLCMGLWGFNFFIEIKDPKKPPSRRRLTAAQERFHGRWQGTCWVCGTAAEVAANVARFFAKGKGGA